MAKSILKNKFLVVAIICFSLIISYSNAFAWGGHERHYYRDGGWYRHGWFGLGVAVSALVIGAVVEGLPFGYRTVVVADVPYYYYDGYYYRHYPYGYVVVPAPVVAPNVVYASPAILPGQIVSGETITINVPNANASYTPVTLVKKNNGYVGPQREYYDGYPTVEQLRVLYGN